MKCAMECCRAKVNTFSTTECKCGNMYCPKHRLMMDHECDKLNERKEEFKRELKVKNPVVKRDKMEKI